MEPVSSDPKVQAEFEVFSAGYDAAINDIIVTFENADSACSDWAIALIKGEK
jgi:hypothetical protein